MSSSKPKEHSCQTTQFVHLHKLQKFNHQWAMNLNPMQYALYLPIWRIINIHERKHMKRLIFDAYTTYLHCWGKWLKRQSITAWTWSLHQLWTNDSKTRIIPESTAGDLFFLFFLNWHMGAAYLFKLYVQLIFQAKTYGTFHSVLFLKIFCAAEIIQHKVVSMAHISLWKWQGITYLRILVWDC